MKSVLKMEFKIYIQFHFFSPSSQIFFSPSRFTLCLWWQDLWFYCDFQYIGIVEIEKKKRRIVFFVLKYCFALLFSLSLAIELIWMSDSFILALMDSPLSSLSDSVQATHYDPLNSNFFTQNKASSISGNLNFIKRLVLSQITQHQATFKSER